MSENFSGEEPASYPFARSGVLEPPAEWAMLRGQCPVRPIRTLAGEDGVILTRYEDIRRFLLNPEFSRFKEHVTEAIAEDSTVEDPAVEGAAGEESAAEEYGDNVFSRFSPRHEDEPVNADPRRERARWRRDVMQSFRPQDIEELRIVVTGIVDQLVGEMTAGQNSADLIKSLASALPVRTLSEILGVEVEKFDDFCYWSDAMTSFGKYEQDEVIKAGDSLFAYMSALAEQRRTQSGGDIISRMGRLTHRDGSRRYNDTGLGMTGLGIVVAGYKAPYSMIGKMMAMLLTRRERWEQLVADPSLVPLAVEECLRFDADSGAGIPRYTPHDVEVAGVTIDRASLVLLEIGSGNRDESVFEHPEEFDIFRSKHEHFTFGLGPNSCLGADLARVQLQTLLSALVTRLPTLELAIPADQLKKAEGDFLVGGVEELPVRW